MSKRTPRLTKHAQERCAEMGITTKRAKRVVQNRTLMYAGVHDNNGYVCMSDDPDICVVWDPETNSILTVLPKTARNYSRSSNQ